MKTTLTTLLHSTLLLVGYVVDSFLLTLSESQITNQSNSSNWFKLLEIEGKSLEYQFSVTKNIDIELCKEVI